MHLYNSVVREHTPHYDKLIDAARDAAIKVNSSESGNPNYLSGFNLVRLVSVLIFSWVVSVLCAIAVSLIVADIFVGFGFDGYITRTQVSVSALSC